MNPEQKQLNMLGLANRAGQLITGDEMVEKAIKRSKVSLVLCASDASQATLERYRGFAERYHVPMNFTFNRAQISQAIGKSRSIIALTSAGMAKTFQSYTT